MPGPWAAGERILVLIAGDAMAAPLVRAGRRLSDMMMDAPWTVTHVDRPSGARHGVGSAGKLSDALKLAEQLGGRTVVLSGDDVVRAVMDHAHQNNVTQIVLAKGATAACRNGWGGLWRRNCCARPAASRFTSSPTGSIWRRRRCVSRVCV